MDPKYILKNLQENHPELEINTLEVRQSCDNYVVEVNQTYIFRFPCSITPAVGLAQEIKLVEYLVDKFHIKLPKYLYVHPQWLYGGYEKIPGVVFTTEFYNALNEQEKEDVASQLANFFYVLHDQQHLSMAYELGLTSDSWPLPPDVLEQQLASCSMDQDLQALFQSMLVDYKSIEVADQDLVLLHHDVFQDNILIDVSARKIAGIIDFSDAALGDRWKDFRLLHLISSDLADRVVRIYAQLEKINPDFQRVDTYYLATEFSRLVEGKQSGCVKQDCWQIIERLKRFAKRTN